MEVSVALAIIKVALWPALAGWVFVGLVRCVWALQRMRPLSGLEFAQIGLGLVVTPCVLFPLWWVSIRQQAAHADATALRWFAENGLLGACVEYFQVAYVTPGQSFWLATASCTLILISIALAVEARRCGAPAHLFAMGTLLLGPLTTVPVFAFVRRRTSESMYRSNVDVRVGWGPWLSLLLALSFFMPVARYPWIFVMAIHASPMVASGGGWGAHDGDSATQAARVRVFVLAGLLFAAVHALELGRALVHFPLDARFPTALAASFATGMSVPVLTFDIASGFLLLLAVLWWDPFSNRRALAALPVAALLLSPAGALAFVLAHRERTLVRKPIPPGV